MLVNSKPYNYYPRPPDFRNRVFEKLGERIYLCVLGISTQVRFLHTSLGTEVWLFPVSLVYVFTDFGPPFFLLSYVFVPFDSLLWYV